MARGRFISNEIARDKEVNSLSDAWSMLGFERLITFADRDGRVHGDPAVVRSLVFPRNSEITIEQMESYIQEWSSAALIIWYEAKGDWWICFPNFAKHQVGMRYDREPESQIPPPPLGNTLDQALGSPQAHPAPPCGLGSLPRTVVRGDGLAGGQASNSDCARDDLGNILFDNGILPTDYRQDAAIVPANIPLNRREENRREEEEEVKAISPPAAAASIVLSPDAILCRASGISAFPGDQLQWATVVADLADDHGTEETIAAMKRACERWVNTTGKNGKKYKKTNLSWINLAQEELARPNAWEIDSSQLTGEELKIYLLESQKRHETNHSISPPGG